MSARHLVGMALALAGCGSESTSSSPRLLTWSVVDVGPVHAEEATDQHHATVATRAGDSLFVWDDEPDRVVARRFGPTGPSGEARTLFDAGFNLGRPDVLPSDDGWWVVHNSAHDVWLSALNADGVLTAQVQVNLAPAEVRGVAEPDLARITDGLVVIWREDSEAPLQSSYLVRRFDLALVPREDPWEAGRSEGGWGAPPDVEGLPDGGFVATWVERNTEQVNVVGWFDGPSEPWATDHIPIETGLNIGRPHVAVAGQVVAVTWRLDELRLVPRGAGLRFYEGGVLLGEELRLGLDPTGANRPVVTGLDDVMLAAWEAPGEPVAICVQPFDAPTAAAFTEPLCLSGETERARPALAIAEERRGYRVQVSWETSRASGDGRAIERASLELGP